jgi:glycosyltransferase involved in cell wall biosynthesis
MAAGKPVVTTSLVNEGLGARPDSEIVLADSAQVTAKQVIKLLHDPTQRETLGSAGRTFVKKRYSWERGLERLREIEMHAGFSSERNVL